METIMAQLLRKLCAKGVQLLDWVDYILFVMQGTSDPSHDPLTCGGELTCRYCMETYRKAQLMEIEIDKELIALGFRFSKKNKPPAQKGEFLGLGWDMRRGVYVLSQENLGREAGREGSGPP